MILRTGKLVVLCMAFMLVYSTSFSSAKSSVDFESVDSNGVNLFHFDANVFRIKHVIPLNMSSNTELTVDVAIPGNDSFQRAWNVTSDPDPDKVFADSFGNRRYRYLISTHQPNFVNITVTYDVLVLFSSLIFSPDDVGALNEIPRDIAESYTKPSPYIESDQPWIIGNATLLVKDVTSVYDRFVSLFNFVSNSTLFPYNISVAEIIGDSSKHIRGALWCLSNRQGVCFDFACLLTALLRSKGIPARVASGATLSSSPGFHAWTEVYLPRIGWVPCDPTWDVPDGSIHLKNPTYGGDTRWNYTLRRGEVYAFPYDSKFINDQAFVEVLAKPRVDDMINILDADYLNFTRRISFNDLDFDSYLIVSRDKGVNSALSYTGLKISPNTESLGISTLEYWSWFSYEPEEMKVTIYAPFSLIVSKAFVSLSSATFVNDFRTLYTINVVQPVLWVSFVLIMILFLTLFLIFFVVLPFRRSRRRW